MRLTKIKKNDVLKFLHITDQHLKNIVYWLKNNKDIKIFEIDNNQDLDIVVGCLTDRLKSRFEKDIKQ